MFDGSKLPYEQNVTQTKEIYALCQKRGITLEAELGTLNDEGKDLETGFGILYDEQCWSLDLRYTRDQDEIIYSFEINLYGIGGFGSGVGHEEVVSRF